VKAYYGVLAIYGLARLAVEHNRPQLLDRVEEILADFPDRIDHPHYNFPSYRVGGNALAYMIFLGRLPARRGELRHYADEMMTAPRDHNGVLEHIHPPRGRIWIDVATAASPFLTFAGRALGDPSFLDEAAHQSIALYDALIDRDIGLLHQCEGFLASGVRSTDHWGRGTGWGILGLAELVDALPAGHPARPDAETRLLDLATALVNYQTAGGLWRQEIPSEEAWEETSGTGLIVYAMALGIRAGVLDADTFLEPVKRGILGLTHFSVNSDYSTEGSCPGTLCPGDGTPHAYVTLRRPEHDEVHSFSAIILAMAAAGIVDVRQVRLRQPVGLDCDLPRSTQ
jgi:unsaturated rhamnogalacturonyl hydrolase